MSRSTAMSIESLPVATRGQLASGWWGMVMLIVTEAALFAALLFCYYYLYSQHASRPWPPEGWLPLKVALPNTIVLILSSVAVAYVDRAMRRGDSRTLRLGLSLGVALGVVFMALQAYEWSTKPFNWTSHTFGSLYYTITGFHMLHVLAGLLMLVVVLAWMARGDDHATGYLALTTTAYYWHFVDFVWLSVFFSFYLWPRLT
jgi:heme/copper-type cytochrome/quinol oxidase subunit 3